MGGLWELFRETRGRALARARRRQHEQWGLCLGEILPGSPGRGPQPRYTRGLLGERAPSSLLAWSSNFSAGFLVLSTGTGRVLVSVLRVPRVLGLAALLEAVHALKGECELESREGHQMGQRGGRACQEEPRSRARRGESIIRKEGKKGQNKKEK